jgi:transketolase
MHNIIDQKIIAKKIRLYALEQTVLKKKGHLGGTYSCVDILVSLFYSAMSFQSKDPLWEDRDRFLLSKGHACLALYPILVDLGFIDKNTIDSYGLNGGLGGQLDISLSGVEWNTGSLGHTLGIASGISLGARFDEKNYHIFTVVGDGEFAEGSVWEALIYIGQNKLNNITCIIDRNRLSVTEVLDDDSFFKNLSPVVSSFGWQYFEIDGHDFSQLNETFSRCKLSSLPTLVVANTIKGKGVSFMENTIKWHHSIPSINELEIARRELNE